MKDLIKIYELLRPTEEILSYRYVLSLNETEFEKWVIVQNTFLYFVKECEKKGINIIDLYIKDNKNENKD